jgi:hypothetical protein
MPARLPSGATAKAVGSSAGITNRSVNHWRWSSRGACTGRLASSDRVSKVSIWAWHRSRPWAAMSRETPRARVPPLSNVDLTAKSPCLDADSVLLYVLVRAERAKANRPSSHREGAEDRRPQDRQQSEPEEDFAGLRAALPRSSPSWP